MESVFVGRLLFGRVISALLDANDKAAAPLGLTGRQGMVLANVARGEATTAIELAAYNGLDISSMSRMLDRLERKKLLQRTRSHLDRRKVVVRLTPKGHALLRKAIPVAAHATTNAWKGVTEREKKTLRTIVHKILRNTGHLQKS